jgi:hypothetical protein
MSIYKNSLLTDHTILWLTGFCTPEQTKPMPDKICNFFGISDRTARRWIHCGLPRYARNQLIMVLDGRMLPPQWKGIQICHDGIRFAGHFLPLNNLKLLPFILKHVDWSKVAPVVHKPGADIQSRRVDE